VLVLTAKNRFVDKEKVRLYIYPVNYCHKGE